jgi:cellulose 1,4-beta-cellobiosidase
MYSAFVSAGFPSTVGMLIDTSRDGWGGPNRPTALDSSPTDVNSYVNANKIDQRPFRGDWCNVNGAGIGARPAVQPYGASDPIIAYVWIKPPGESDGDYPTASHTHGDAHCDPNGTQTDGNGGTYPTDAIPGYDVPAGQWFAYQFQMLVKNAYPALGSTSGGGGGGSLAAPTGLKVTGTTSDSVSLGWTASTSTGVTGYAVYRGATKVATVTGTTYTDTGLTAATSYTYTVVAQDAAGDVSPASAAVTATTASSGGGGGGGGSGCTASYAVSNAWGTGFTATVTVTAGSSAINGWKVSWTFGGNQSISNAWNATVTQSGSSVTAANASYNGSLGAGASTSFGFQASYSGSNPVPTATCTAS